MEAVSFLKSGELKVKGLPDYYVNFIQEKHLKNAKTWAKFVEVFKDKDDSIDNGWRGEYWGKMMRGAALCYYYSKDQELYSVLENTVKDLLLTQDEYGRFSAYNLDTEFHGWDVWGRKYVATALFHFMDICKDTALNQKILEAVKAHFDYIIEKLGDGEGKTQITKTSGIWGGVNSCTILEPVVEAYKRTGEKRYLDFAEYIISTGGCADGNLIEEVIKKTLPSECSVKKAYEVMSFFEGLLAYYEVTKKEKYLEVVKTFVDLVKKEEITIIGCAGMNEECFNGAADKQAQMPLKPTQETCVGVTWMRLLLRLYKLTGEFNYYDCIETSALNDLYGSINVNGLENHSSLGFVTGIFGFDSYSPLLDGYRDTETGGQRKLKDGSYYGCCACIGAAGVAIVPLTAIMKKDKGYVINTYHNASVSSKDFAFSILGNYLEEGKICLTIDKADCAEKEFTLRVPNWCKEFNVKCDGAKISKNGNAVTVIKTWQIGDEIKIDLKMQITSVVSGEYTAFTYGPIVLARDNYKEEGLKNTGVKVSEVKTKISSEQLKIKKTEKQGLEMVRFEFSTDEDKILLTDYASCGKWWQNKDNQISVWLKERKN